MKRASFLKAAILIFTFVISLIVAEFLLRIFTSEPENLVKLKSSSIFLYENNPGSEFEYKTGEFLIKVKMNSFGFRDEEFSKNKPEGVFRIAVLGDSQEEALQVELYDTWQKIMARKLSDTLSKKVTGRIANTETSQTKDSGSLIARVETYNFGVSGYGTDQQWLNLREKVWQFEPDMVILAFSPNDVGDTYKNKLVYLKDGSLQLVSASERAGGNFLGKLARQTYLYHLIIKASLGNEFAKSLVDEVRVKVLGFVREERFYLSDAQLTQGPFELVASSKYPPKEVKEAWELVFALIEDMNRQASSHGAKFLITINIPRAQIDQNGWEGLLGQYHFDPANFSPYQINDELKRFANEKGFSIYDPRLDAIKWVSEKGILHFPIDAHFNKNGHVFMGEKVADFLIQSKIF